MLAVAAAAHDENVIFQTHKLRQLAIHDAQIERDAFKNRANQIAGRVAQVQPQERAANMWVGICGGPTRQAGVEEYPVGSDRRLQRHSDQQIIWVALIALRLLPDRREQHIAQPAERAAGGKDGCC